MARIPGLHHVTAISGRPQPNVSFYTRVLRQRLVKRTVNFDAPDTYHLYYGDAAGTPGTIMTFFPFANATPGQVGPGMASAHAYAVVDGRFDALLDRLAQDCVATAPLHERFGARVATLRDPDGAAVELVETSRAPSRPDDGGESDLDGFHSVTLWSRDLPATARLLTDVFGYRDAGSENLNGVERLRLVADCPAVPQPAPISARSVAAPGTAPVAARGAVIDLIRSDSAPTARRGAGTIHHIAFRAPTADDQLHWQDRLATAGLPPTPVIDRQYFTAIYVREPGGILFEIATDAPGFAVDEPAATLGQALMLPPQHEHLRAQLERSLPPLHPAR